MDGAIIGERGFLIGRKRDQITCNDAIKQFRNEKLFTGQSYRELFDKDRDIFTEFTIHASLALGGFLLQFP